MNKFISKVTMNWKVATAVAVFAVVALFGAPRAYQALYADTPAACANAPQNPTLNPYPVTITNEACKDWPAIWAGKNGQYPTSFEQLYAGWNATSGDEFEVRVYIHNGQPAGSPDAARGVNAVVTVNDTAEPEHVIGSTVTSSNAGTVNGSFAIRTAADERLEIVPGSAHLQNWFGQTDNGAGTVSITSHNGEPAVKAYLNDLPGCFDQSKFVVFKVRVVKTQGQTPINPSYNINTQLGSPTAECLYNGTVVWNTANVNDVLVTVSDPDLNSNNYYGNDTIFASGDSGSQTVGWIQPEKPYRFALWEVNPAQGGQSQSFRVYNNGRQSYMVKLLSESWMPAGAALNCGSPTTPSEESFNLSISMTDVCANTNVPVFTVSNATSGLIGKQIKWSSTFNNTPTAEVDTYYGHIVGSNGSWSGPGGVFNDSQIGAWTKTAKINGITRTVSFRVKNCSEPVEPAPVVQTLVCSPQNRTTEPYTSVNFTASGGTGVYNWTAIGSTKVIGSGRDFSTSYASRGTYEVRVISGTQSASCGVTVTVPATLVCSPLNQNAQVNQFVNLTATGGEGAYQWTITGGNPQVGTGSSFSTRFTNPGNYPIAVHSGGQTVYCNVNVSQTTVQPNPLTCSASASSILAGQSVSFSAAGGEGAFSWKVNNASVSGNSSNYTATFNQPGSYVATVTRGNQSVNCPVVAVTQPAQTPTLTCVASATNVQTGQVVNFTAQGGEGTYSWNVNNTNVGNNSSAYSAAFSQAGTYNVRVTRGTQTANCPAVVVVNPTPVCVPNTNGIISASAISELFGGKYSTNISWSFSGNNPVKVSYINPDNGQEVVFVASVNQSGSKQFNNFDPNKDYAFKLYDLSNCGGLMSTFVLRKTTSTVCVPNSNFALNVGSVVKSGSTYNATINWTSTGSHQVKIAQNSTGNVIATGNNTGSFTVTGLAAGSSHSFYMIDAECNTTLATATVNIPQDTATGGNCNNSTNSCNNNNNTTTVTGNNNNTVTNNTNINGNNNTVNNVNTCVNNSCNNWYYITNQGSTVPANEFRQLAITKSVRSQNGSFTNSVTVNGNDIVEFQIVVTNSGNQVVNNVRVTDYLPSGLSYVSGYDYQNYYVGSLMAGQSRTLTFQARVNGSVTNGIQNIARAIGDSVSEVQDDAWVFTTNVAGGNVNLTYSKKAWNDTKNVDAQSTPAAREDYITYTLTVTNSGNTPANSFVITDDLSQVLPYADIVDNGGGQISGNVITYPAVTIPSGSTVTKSFKVRVKYYLAQNLSYVMTNTYGNTVTVRINTPQVLGAYVAPKTGADAMTAGIFAATLTGLFAAFKKRETLLGLLLGQ